jgi:hypothetical protein
MLFVAGCESYSSSSGVTITPTSATVSASSVTNITFDANGGIPPYTWSVSNPGIGSIAVEDASGVFTPYALNNSSADYTASGALGTNVVVVTDADSNSASAIIIQE